MIFMTHGQTSPQAVRPHEDLLAHFPYLGPPNPQPHHGVFPRRRVTDTAAGAEVGTGCGEHRLHQGR
ncbi:MAG TPA: hypothetical protein VNO54_01910, partial [Streptosporangiaceae bacterium]|nr:hypothetical protein [Streptosporangiaceae bacterium]